MNVSPSLMFVCGGGKDGGVGIKIPDILQFFKKKLDMCLKYTDAPALWPLPRWLFPLAPSHSPTPSMIHFPNPGLCINYLWSLYPISNFLGQIMVPDLWFYCHFACVQYDLLYILTPCPTQGVTTMKSKVLVWVNIIKFQLCSIKGIKVMSNLDVCLCWGFTAQSTQGVMSSAVSLPNHTFTGQA